ncbi:MAG TPA: hypothetical protein DCM86_07905, partial [Verrucomicrobiales bacterium]|nr:hypothetical protein [Verrucomicrobiales bacterium]
NDILDFSKIEAGKLQLESIPFDLLQIAEEVGALLSTKAHEKQIDLALQFDSSIPREWVGDPVRVRQVMLNLVGNAIKFTTAGHVLIEVAPSPTTRSTSRPMVRIGIQDTGIGISPEKKHLLFQKFQQMDSSTTRKFGGTGLGLAISKLLVELMGGEIGVDSLPGSGSTFWFEIPTPGSVAIPSQKFYPAPEVAQGRVLVVDNAEINRRVLQHQLTQWGMACDTAEGAAAALEILRRAAGSGTPYDLVLTDYLMPGADGVDLARAIRQEPSIAHTGIALLSSSGQRFDPKPGEEDLFAITVLKPMVRITQLVEAVAKAHAQAATLRQTRRGVNPPIPAPREPITPEAPRGTVSPASISPPSQPAPRADTPAPGGNGLQILLVEDNPVNQKLARRLLENQGHRVTTAENGLLGVDRALNQAFDLILMDCQMPEMDGFQATAEIRRLEQQGAIPGRSGRPVPIIALTANAIQGDRDRCLAAGMNDYVTKPVSAEALRQAIARQGSGRLETRSW